MTHWWMLVLRGVLAVIFGIAAVLVPGITLAALVFMFGAYAIVDGGAGLYSAWMSRTTNDRWWLFALEGLAGVIAGVLAFILPGITALLLLYLIAGWSIITGVIEIIAAVQLRKEITNEIWLGLAGVLSIIFGLAIALFPGAGALAIVWVIGLYAITFGVMLILLGFRLRTHHEGIGTTSSPTRIYEGGN